MPGMACVCAGDDGQRGKRGSGFSSSMGGRIVRDDGAPHGAERHDLFGRGNQRAFLLVRRSFSEGGWGASGDAGARAPGSSPRLLVRAELPTPQPPAGEQNASVSALVVAGWSKSVATAGAGLFGLEATRVWAGKISVV